MSDQPLCTLDDIPDGGAKGVDLGEGVDATSIILLRRGGDVFGYVNRCPHMGTPLETFPDRFLNQTGDLLICSTHGARFRVSDGYCVSGPCKDASLESVPLLLRDNQVFLA